MKLSLLREAALQGKIHPMNTQDQKWAVLKKSEDPYAYWNIFGDPEEFQQSFAVEMALPSASQPRRREISKKGFQDGCRRILLQYVPPTEGRVLRSHYRDFITRNELRSSEQRFRLLEELSKYDVSASGNLKPHFNLDAELFTAAKLQEIERLALADSHST